MLLKSLVSLCSAARLSNAHLFYPEHSQHHSLRAFRHLRAKYFLTPNVRSPGFRLDSQAQG
jgi:hypothetical protein